MRCALGAFMRDTAELLDGLHVAPLEGCTMEKPNEKSDAARQISAMGNGLTPGLFAIWSLKRKSLVRDPDYPRKPAAQPTQPPNS